MKIKVLVTGAGGYIGSLLCPKLLENGYEVLGIDLIEKLSGAPWISGDASDESLMKPLMKRADILIPLAAVVGAPLCDKNPDQAKKINFEAIKTLIELRSKNQLIIFPMTNNGYRPDSSQSMVTEENHFETDSLYTLTKFQAEKAVMEAGNSISFRLASLFGVSPSMRWDLLIHYYIRQACTEGVLHLYESAFKRNFVHAQDVVDAFLFAINNAAAMKNQIYNLALDSANLSKMEIAQMIQKHLPDLKINPVEHGKVPVARFFFISTQKLRSAGFEAKRSLSAGILEVFQNFQAQRELKGVA